MLDEPALRKILRSVGLHIGRDVLNYLSGDFARYTTREYLTSERHKTDGAYRMFEGNLLHKDSGLRVTYTSAEDYYGEHVDYKVIAMFILTNKGQTIDITDVDLERRVFETALGDVPFSETDRVRT